MDKTALDSAIVAAFAEHRSAVEGLGHGLHKYGARMRYLRSIYVARRALRNEHATREDVDIAAMYLDIARRTFREDAVDTTTTIFSGTATDSVMMPKMKFEHMFTFTLDTDSTYTLFDSVSAFREKVLLQMGDWQMEGDRCTFTSTLCMTLDIVNLEMVVDTLMAPYVAEIVGDTMTIHEFGYLGAVPFARQ